MQRLFYLFITILSLTGCDFHSPALSTTEHAKAGVNAAVISHDARIALVASVNHAIGLWDLEQQTLQFAWQHDRRRRPEVIAMAISPHSQYALTAEKKQIILWNTHTGRAIKKTRIPQHIMSVSLGPQARIAVLGLRNGNIEIINPRNGQTLARYEQNGAISQITLSRDGRYILSASDDYHVQLWDFAKKKRLYQWQFKNKLSELAISPFNKFILTSESHGKQQLWDINTGKLVRSLGTDKSTVTCARFAENKPWLVLGKLPGRLELWNTHTGQLLQKWQLPRKSIWKPSATIIYATAFNQNLSEIYTEDSRGISSRYQIKSL